MKTLAADVILAVLLATTLPSSTHSQDRALSRPAQNGLWIREGTTTGSGGVLLFYRYVNGGTRLIATFHGGPGVGIDDGGYDIEPQAEKGNSILMFDQRGVTRSEVVTNAARLGIDSHVLDVEAISDPPQTNSQQGCGTISRRNPGVRA